MQSLDLKNFDPKKNRSNLSSFDATNPAEILVQKDANKNLPKVSKR